MFIAFCPCELPSDLRGLRITYSREKLQVSEMSRFILSEIEATGNDKATEEKKFRSLGQRRSEKDPKAQIQ